MKTKYILIAALIPFLSLVSCKKDFLEEELVATLTSDYFNTEQGLEDLIKSSYEHTRTKYTYEWAYAFWNFGTDEFTQADQLNHNYYNTYDQRLNTGTDWFIHEVWATYYDGINRCNTGIENIPKIKGVRTMLTEADKNKKIAELRFLRGYYYFTLVQQYGAIPLQLNPTSGVQTEYTRASVADVYKAILADFRFAAEHLPPTQSQRGRATKGAAQHFAAKAYLTRGSAVTDQRGQQPTDIDSAAYYADQVINSSVYSLEPDFARLWDISNYAAHASAMRSPEIIFAAQWNNDPLLSGRFGNQTHLYFTMAYDIQPGMVRDLLNGRPFRRCMPTDYAMDIYDRKNDSRFYKSFKLTYISNNDKNIPSWTQSDAPSPDLVGKKKFEVGDTAIYIMVNNPETAITEQQIKHTRYNLFPRYYKDANGELKSAFADRAKFPALVKYIDPFRTSVASQYGTKDGIIARLAETYLIAAEAHGRMGNYAKALEYVNALRRRAAYKPNEVKNPAFWMVEGGSPDDKEGTFDKIMATEELFTTNAPSEMYPPSVSATPDRFIHFILNERSRELMGELHRWEDLVRTETLLVRAQAFNKDAVNIQPFHKLRPIPQEHLERITRNGQPLTAEQRQNEQNPGY